MRGPLPPRHDPARQAAVRIHFRSYALQRVALDASSSLLAGLTQPAWGGSDDLPPEGRNMDRSRLLNALALLIPLSFAGVCDTWEERPDDPRPVPIILGVTAPDFAPPGSEVMVRVAWMGDCGTRFVRFDLSRDREGIWLLYPRWNVPKEPPGCLPEDSKGLEQIQLLTMPSSGALRFRIEANGEALTREVHPGEPGAERILRMSVISLPGSRPHPAVTVDLFAIHHVREDGTFSVGGERISVGETDSTGVLDIDLRILEPDQPCLFLAQDPIARTTRVIPLLAAPIAGRAAEHMTLLVKAPARNRPN